MRVHLPAQGEIETDKVITGIEALKGLTELEFKEVVRSVEKYFKEKKRNSPLMLKLKKMSFWKK